MLEVAAKLLDERQVIGIVDLERLEPAERGLDRRQVCGLAFVQGKFQLAFGGNLGTRVFRLSEVVGGGFGAADDTTALRGQLGQQLGLLGQ